MCSTSLLHHFFPGSPVVESLEGVPAAPSSQGCEDDGCKVVVAHEAAPRARMAAAGPFGLRRGLPAGPPVIARARVVGCTCLADGKLVEITGPLAGTQPDDLLAHLDNLQRRAEGDRAWVELRAVLLAGRSDSDRQVDLLTRTLHDRLGADIPLHLTVGGPLEGTHPNVTLQNARWIAMSNGMRWVYTDDVADPSARCTWCPGCDALLLDRAGGETRIAGLANGACIRCGWTVPGRFPEAALAA